MNPPKKIFPNFTICLGSACRHRGGESIWEEFETLLHDHPEADELNESPCMGACKRGPNAIIRDRFWTALSLPQVAQFIDPQTPSPPTTLSAICPHCKNGLMESRPPHMNYEILLETRIQGHTVPLWAKVLPDKVKLESSIAPGEDPLPAKCNHCRKLLLQPDQLCSKCLAPSIVIHQLGARNFWLCSKANCQSWGWESTKK